MACFVDGMAKRALMEGNVDYIQDGPLRPIRSDCKGSEGGSWCGKRDQGVDPICSPLTARIDTTRRGRQQEHGVQHCGG